MGIPLVIATSSHQQAFVQALEDGRVDLPGCEARFVSLIPGDNVLLTRAFDDPEFNVSELSLSKYVSLREAGTCPYVAIPVFIARSFRHGDIYIRTDRGIRAPGDLRGLRVGTGDYRHTAHVWVRALLQDEYGVHPSDIRWVVGHREKAYEPPADVFTPPPDVSIELATDGLSLSQMLERGDIDALISPLVPSCFSNGAPHVGRMFADPDGAALDYFDRSAILPIVHLMAVRNELVAAHPDLPTVLTRAFALAKDAWRNSLPESAGEVDRRIADAYAYGLEAPERATLAAFLHHHHRQGLSARLLAVDELFTPVGSSRPRGTTRRNGAGVGSMSIS